jgi:hypothetical protein
LRIVEEAFGAFPNTRAKALGVRTAQSLLRDELVVEEEQKAVEWCEGLREQGVVVSPSGYAPQRNLVKQVSITNGIEVALSNLRVEQEEHEVSTTIGEDGFAGLAHVISEHIAVQELLAPNNEVGGESDGWGDSDGWLTPSSN